MSMAWVKLHTEILGDPKLMRAAEEGHTHLALIPWLLLFAKRANDGGRLTVGGEAADPEDIAHHIPGATPQDVLACMVGALAAGYLRRGKDGVPFFPVRERPPIPNGVRYLVFERDDFQCRYCGSPDDLEIDHVYPWSIGGTHDIDNLQLLCRPCNRAKGARV